MAALKTGASVAGGFTVLEAREGRFELVKELPNGSTVHFDASTEAKVLAKAASWTADQLRRKGGGALGASPVTVVARGG